MDQAAGWLDAMVRTQLASRDIRDPRVLGAMRRVDRAAFVPADQKVHAYEDRPLPIGAGQTISQPYMVAIMTQSLDLRGTERVLEIGTGSGYQTAILALLAAEVYTIEVHATLIEQARGTLERLGYRNVHYAVHRAEGGVRARRWHCREGAWPRRRRKRNRTSSFSSRTTSVRTPLPRSATRTSSRPISTGL